MDNLENNNSVDELKKNEQVEIKLRRDDELTKELVKEQPKEQEKKLVLKTKEDREKRIENKKDDKKTKRLAVIALVSFSIVVLCISGAILAKSLFNGSNNQTTAAADDSTYPTVPSEINLEEEEIVLKEEAFNFTVGDKSFTFPVKAEEILAIEGIKLVNTDILSPDDILVDQDSFYMGFFKIDDTLLRITFSNDTDDQIELKDATVREVYVSFDNMENSYSIYGIDENTSFDDAKKALGKATRVAISDADIRELGFRIKDADGIESELNVTYLGDEILYISLNYGLYYEQYNGSNPNEDDEPETTAPETETQTEETKVDESITETETTVQEETTESTEAPTTEEVTSGEK